VASNAATITVPRRAVEGGRSDDQSFCEWFFGALARAGTLAIALVTRAWLLARREGLKLREASTGALEDHVFLLVGEVDSFLEHRARLAHLVSKCEYLGEIGPEPGARADFVGAVGDRDRLVRERFGSLEIPPLSQYPRVCSAGKAVRCVVVGIGQTLGERRVAFGLLIAPCAQSRWARVAETVERPPLSPISSQRANERRSFRSASAGSSVSANER
jgi:hypothetical protein